MRRRVPCCFAEWRCKPYPILSVPSWICGCFNAKTMTFLETKTIPGKELYIDPHMGNWAKNYFRAISRVFLSRMRRPTKWVFIMVFWSWFIMLLCGFVMFWVACCQYTVEQLRIPWPLARLNNWAFIQPPQYIATIWWLQEAIRLMAPGSLVRAAYMNETKTCLGNVVGTSICWLSMKLQSKHVTWIHMTHHKSFRQVGKKYKLASKPWNSILQSADT